MNGEIVLSVVGDVDDDPVAFPGVDGRPWKSAVHRDDGLRMAQPANVLRLNLNIFS